MHAEFFSIVAGMLATIGRIRPESGGCSAAPLLNPVKEIEGGAP